MLEGTGMIPWILAAIGAVVLGVLIVIVIKCIRGMNKFHQDDKSPVEAVRCTVVEKIKVVAKKRTPKFIPSELEGEDVYVILEIDGEKKQLDVSYNVFTEIRDGMTGTAQIKAGRVVGFISDDGRIFGNEHNLSQSARKD